FPFDGFGPLYEHHFSVGHTGSPEDVILNRLRSISFIAALGADEREKIDSEVKALIASEPLLASKDVVTVPYETAAFYVEKLAR
ncbi:MAG TPA: SAM-dependent methyltransferase, partial [Caballeronia sp.]|nr:SAM-dependent methyltransferase [Caballeronia sp.]